MAPKGAGGYIYIYIYIYIHNWVPGLGYVVANPSLPRANRPTWLNVFTPNVSKCSPNVSKVVKRNL